MTALLSLLLLAAPEWKQVKAEDGIIVEARAVEGSPYAELRATATVAVPAEALCAGAFGTPKKDPKEPSLKTRRVISESEDERVTYDQIKTPVISDRDYAVRTVRTRLPNGTCRVSVNLALEAAPPVLEDHVRLKKLRCSWDFEPLPDGRTKLTYIVWTDPDTALPTFMVEPSRHGLMVTWVKLVTDRGLAQPKPSAPAPAP